MKKEKLPPWEPRNEAQRKQFIEWTIGKWMDLAGDEGYRQSQLANLPDIEQPSIFALVRALSTNNSDMFVRLMRDANQARHAYDLIQKLQEAPGKRRVGRPNKPKDREHPLDWSLSIVDEIQSIWKQHYKRSQRNKNAPSVYEIAAIIMESESVKDTTDPEARSEYRQKLAEEIRAFRRNRGHSG